MSSSPPLAPQDAPAIAAPNPVPARPASTRMPSLNQVAARLTSNASNANTPSGARPRLPTSLLARTSNSSLVTNDSTAVQPPTTRSTSPALSSHRSASPTDSNRESITTTSDVHISPNAPGNELTEEHLQRLDLADRDDVVSVVSNSSATSATRASGAKPSRGYKNVPSLEAITQRLRIARAKVLSTDGTEAPPPAPASTATTAADEKPKEHPLEHNWTLYHDTKARATFTPQPGEAATPYVPPSTETGAYEAGLTVVGEFDTVETFCRYFNWLKPPSKLERNSNYHLFKSGIKPMWEDEANANGGKWVLTMKSQPQLLDRCWSWLTMALVGEELDEDEICGAVVSLRSKVDRIQLWIRSKEDVERINSLGRKLVKLLDIGEAEGVGLEFQYNTDERPTPQKFLSIQASIPQSGFRSTFSPHGGSFVGPGRQGHDGAPVSRGGHGGGESSAASSPGSGRDAFAAGGGGAFGGGGSWRPGVGGKK